MRGFTLKQSGSLSIKSLFSRCSLSLILFVFLISSLTLSSQHAYAHGDSAVTLSPAQGSVLPSLPEKVKITFTEAINTSTGELTVLDPSGKNIALDVTVSTTSIESNLAPASYSGVYKITYQVLSLDGSTLAKSYNVILTTGDKFKDTTPQTSTTKKNNTLKTNNTPNLILPITLSVFILLSFLFVFLSNKKRK